MLLVDEVLSSVGTWRVAEQSGAIVALGAAESFDALLLRRFGGAPEVRAARTSSGDRLRAYLAGDAHAFEGAQVEPGGTPFQNAVWRAVRAIPAGETRTYGAIAAALGKQGAARAVGAANGRNPAALAIPCHRVVSPDGLRGYAWGLERKRWLLALEQA